jgi:hypothetical protein
MCVEDIGIDPEFSCIFVLYILVKSMALFKMLRIIFSSFFPRLAKSATFSPLCSSPEAEFLDEILTKVLRVVLVAIYSRLYIFALRFLFLHTHAVSYSFYSSITAH